MPDDLAFATVTQLADLLRRRDLSSVELTRVTLDRLDRIGRVYNAVASLLPERARHEAERADAAFGRGDRVGPLHGIPYGAKDLLAAKGAPTTWGSPLYADRVIDDDAAAIGKLRAVGGVLVAKLAMSELASFGTGSAYASMHGPGRNPWDPTRWAGGSSTGSAAVVAAGLLPYALASETAGSIGSPSAYCGITGLRPTYGLVSGYGAMPHSWTVDKVGVMTHTAADCGVVLEAIAGGDRRDHGSAFKRFRSRDVSAVRDSGLASVRIGVADYDFEVEATPPVRPALAEGLRAIRDLGVQERAIALPTGVPYLALTSAIVTGEVSSALAPLIERDGIDRLTRPEQRTALRAAASASARDYIDGQRIRLALQRDLALIFANVDVLVSYTLPWTANSLDTDFTAVPMRGGNGALIVAGNLAGLPALFVPVGLATDGLPVGMQLVGRPFAEATLIAIGEALQSATNWHTLRPPIPAEGATAPSAPVAATARG
jgi:Asp-tRNA(Asn)/Glu-tRNA(Gln) amidotransferase A subunit family amidase